MAFEMAWRHVHKYEEIAVDMFCASLIRVGKEGILYFFVAQKKSYTVIGEKVIAFQTQL